MIHLETIRCGMNKRRREEFDQRFNSDLHLISSANEILTIM